jgi:regulator of protease activity HflC (stomatin/prohibitin superfamily)
MVKLKLRIGSLSPVESLFIILPVVVLLLVMLNPFSVVGPAERGVKIFLGSVGEEVLTPGLHVHAPVVGSIRKFSIRPRDVQIKVPVGPSGAISKDNQTLGFEGIVFWRYSTDKIVDIARQYSNETLKSIIEDNVITAIKVTIGSFKILELAEAQDFIIRSATENLRVRVASYPVEIAQLNISNWDWSDNFDRQIEETMRISQQVRQAQQELLVVEQTTQRQIKEAEAKKLADIALAEARLRTAELDAQAVVAKANGERDARVAEGEGEAKYYASLQSTLNTAIRMRELEIQEIEAKRFDGRRVPSYVPLSPNGGVVTLPSR